MGVFAKLFAYKAVFNTDSCGNKKLIKDDYYENMLPSIPTKGNKKIAQLA